MKPTSSARRGAGTKKDVRANRNPNCPARGKAQRHRTGHRRRDEIDRGSGVMAERKADLAIVVRQHRRRRADWRHDGWRAASRKRKRVVVPTEQRGLEEYRKNAEKCGPTARRRRPRLAGPSLEANLKCTSR